MTPAWLPSRAVMLCTNVFYINAFICSMGAWLSFANCFSPYFSGRVSSGMLIRTDDSWVFGWVAIWLYWPPFLVSLNCTRVFGVLHRRSRVGRLLSRNHSNKVINNCQPVARMIYLRVFEIVSHAEFRDYCQGIVHYFPFLAFVAHVTIPVTRHHRARHHIVISYAAVPQSLHLWMAFSAHSFLSRAEG